ncbi:MAG TPA: glycosyl hydrolase family 18 protein [Bacillota bacterium]|nr:glycosyl hydrolase family 18 protein [Bacillota bacterium]
MRLKKFRLLCIGLVPILVFALVLGGCAKAKKPGVGENAPNVLPSGKRIEVTGFMMPKEMGGGDSYPSLTRYAKYINTISPLWYTVMPGGEVRDRTDRQVLSFAKSKGIKVIPLVNVAKSNDEVLTSPAVRDKVIAQLMAYVKKHNLDGLNIDFEFMPDGTKDFVKDKDLLTAFMARINKQLKASGKTVAMSVIPHYQVAEEIGGIYDYRKLAPYVDVVTLMLYDRHQAGSPPGPISPLQWVNLNIDSALKEGFRPDQICMGVATYGYDWPAGKSGGFSKPTREILAQAQKSGVEVKWSDKYSVPYYLYKDPDSGVTREVWFESSHTLVQKIAVGKKHNVKGICIWRLGFETPSFWTELNKDIGIKK